MIQPTSRKIVRILFLFLICATLAIESPAQVFKTLVEFNYSNGAEPVAPLVQGTDGLYGTTQFGLTNNYFGTLFKITPASGLKTLYHFCSQNGLPCPIGAEPMAPLLLATDGVFYGTTIYGGPPACSVGFGCGTAFKVTPTSVTELYGFCAQPSCTDGAYPSAGLVQAADGSFYGTTTIGGSYFTACQLGCGTIFKIAGGVLSTVYSFCAQPYCVDGFDPSGPLLQATDGKFYGTTAGAGGNGEEGGGTIFKMTADGTLTTLYTFNGNGVDGLLPAGGLVQGSDGNFYGATGEGGLYNDAGTVFKITPGGTLTTMYNFCAQPGCPDGKLTYAALVQGTDGNFYGTTLYGGDSPCIPEGCGTVFQITPSGTLTTLHSFGGSDGQFPYAGLVQATDGKFYGTTAFGGVGSCTNGGAPIGCGTIFSLDMGLGPFVTFVRSYGKVGQTGGILGQGFAGTSSVSLNGIQASFTVVSDTFIKATVPAGATTGFVTVTTPSRTLTSNVPFHVLP